MASSDPDINKFLLDTEWGDASQMWLKPEYQRLFKAKLAWLTDRSGKNLLKYFSMKDATPELKNDMDKEGYSYYKLFTLAEVTTEQKEKLHKNKKFKEYVGKLLFFKSKSIEIISKIGANNSAWIPISGEGASGVCVRVHDTMRKVDQVMKIQYLDTFENENAKREFEREVYLMTRLSSPHVVRIEEGKTSWVA